MNVLISVDSLTDMIYDLMRAEFANVANVSVVSFDLVEQAVIIFNREDGTEATDYIYATFTEKGLWIPDNVAAIDRIVAEFTGLFDICKTEGSRAVAEYNRTTNEAIVKIVPCVKKATYLTDSVKEEYNHALERNDFMSDRLRRAFEEISR